MCSSFLNWTSTSSPSVSLSKTVATATRNFPIYSTRLRSYDCSLAGWSIFSWLVLVEQFPAWAFEDPARVCLNYRCFTLGRQPLRLRWFVPSDLVRSAESHGKGINRHSSESEYALKREWNSNGYRGTLLASGSRMLAGPVAGSIDVHRDNGFYVQFNKQPMFLISIPARPAEAWPAIGSQLSAVRWDALRD